MRKLILIAYLLMSIKTVCYSQEASITVNVEDVDVPPVFKEGGGNIKCYIDREVEYRSFGVENGISGKVTISFIVNKEGNVTNVRLVKGIHRVLNQKLVDCINGMPTWEPGIENGKPTEVEYTVDIKYNMSNNEGIFLITSKNDTIYGSLDILIHEGGRNLKVWVNKGTPFKMVFKAAEIKEIHDYNRVYAVKPHKPEKNSNELVLMTEIINSGKYRLLNVNSLFFLYQGDKFITRLNRKNYKELVARYFNECPRFVREMKYNKNVSLFDIESTYHRFCN